MHPAIRAWYSSPVLSTTTHTLGIISQPSIKGCVRMWENFGMGKKLANRMAFTNVLHAYYFLL